MSIRQGGTKCQLSGMDTEVVEYHNCHIYLTVDMPILQLWRKHEAPWTWRINHGASLPDVSRRCGNSEGIMKSINNK